MSFQSRVEKAKMVQKDSKVLIRNNKKLDYVIAVPSVRKVDNPYGYQIMIEGVKGNYTYQNRKKVNYLQLNTVCLGWLKEDGTITAVMEDCPGTKRGYITYHVLAAIGKLSERKGKKFYAFDDKAQAVNFLNLGGQLVKVVNKKYNGQVVWGVIK